MNEPFSFQVLKDAQLVELPPVQRVTATDGGSLAYRCFIPPITRAVVLFYHGGGAHGGAGYQHLGHGLLTEFDTATYLPDLRGHGASGGARGDAPRPQQIWSDITTLIRRIRSDLPNVPLFLGGHSSGAGLVLNYASWSDHEVVEGYLFVAPEFGFRAKTSRTSVEHPFARASVAPFIINAISGGRLCGHYPAVQFNYDAEVLAADRSMIVSYSVNMANAVTPSAPDQQMAELDRPFALWIGANDEVLLPSAVLALAERAQSVRSQSLLREVPGEQHISILVNAHQLVGPWVTQPGGA